MILDNSGQIVYIPNSNHNKQLQAPITTRTIFKTSKHMAPVNVCVYVCTVCTVCEKEMGMREKDRERRNDGTGYIVKVFITQKHVQPLN